MIPVPRRSHEKLALRSREVTFDTPERGIHRESEIYLRVSIKLSEEALVNN